MELRQKQPGKAVKPLGLRAKASERVPFHSILAPSLARKHLFRADWGSFRPSRSSGSVSKRNENGIWAHTAPFRFADHWRNRNNGLFHRKKTPQSCNKWWGWTKKSTSLKVIEPYKVGNWSRFSKYLFSASHRWLKKCFWWIDWLLNYRRVPKKVSAPIRAAWEYLNKSLKYVYALFTNCAQNSVTVRIFRGCTKTVSI